MLIWKYDFKEKEGFSNNSNTLANGKSIFALSTSGEINALDLILGKKLWSTNSFNVLPQIVFSIDKQKLILLSKEGEIIFISSKDGKQLDKIDLMKPDTFSFITAENEEKVFIGFYDGSLYSIDKKNKVQQLTSPTNIPITSIGFVKEDEFILNDVNGKITFYKIK